MSFKYIFPAVTLAAGCGLAYYIWAPMYRNLHSIRKDYGSMETARRIEAAKAEEDLIDMSRTVPVQTTMENPLNLSPNVIRSLEKTAAAKQTEQSKSH